MFWDMKTIFFLSSNRKETQQIYVGGEKNTKKNWKNMTYLNLQWIIHFR